jgi:hypothetical protein
MNEQKQRPVVDQKKRQATPWPLVTVGVFGTVLLLAAFAMAWLQFIALGTTIMQDETTEYYWDLQQYDEGGDGLAAATGVITRLDEESATVAGGGQEVVVVITDETRVIGGADGLKVNDTVYVYGAENTDTTITATRIVVDNDGQLAVPMIDQPRPKSNVPSA